MISVYACVLLFVDIIMGEPVTEIKHVMVALINRQDHGLRFAIYTGPPNPSFPRNAMSVWCATAMRCRSIKLTITRRKNAQLVASKLLAPTHTMRRFSVQQCTLLFLLASRSTNSTSAFVVWCMISFGLRSSTKLASLKSMSRECCWLALTSSRTSNSKKSFRTSTSRKLRMNSTRERYW